MITRTISALTLLAVVPFAMTAQQPRALPAPDASFDEPFSSVSGLRELSNGRVIVADGRDKLLQMIDLRTGNATQIGREGSGPGEFSLPFRVFGLRGDTTYLFDVGNSRYLIIGPDGKPTTSFRMEESVTAGRAGGGIRIGGGMARGADDRGRLYSEQPGMTQGPDGRPQQADSAAILRYDRVSQRTDTVGFVKLAANNVQTTGSGGNNINVVIGMANPLAPRDEWTVFPDGRVAIVRAEPYRVDWVSASGTKSSSAALAYTPLRVTDADKKEEEALRTRNMGQGIRMMVTDGPEGRRTSASMGGGGGAQMQMPPIADWPATKPPFRSGQASVWARPSGELWVRRTEPAGAKGTLYDAINAQGVVTHQVRIGEGLNLVGFGNGTVYTTKADEDDLLTLQRHRMP